jgi:hypothetical protein
MSEQLEAFRSAEVQDPWPVNIVKPTQAPPWSIRFDGAIFPRHDKCHAQKPDQRVDGPLSPTKLIF